MSRRARSRAEAMAAKRIAFVRDPVDDPDEDDFENDDSADDTEGGSVDIQCHWPAQSMETHR